MFVIRILFIFLWNVLKKKHGNILYPKSPSIPHNKNSISGLKIWMYYLSRKKKKHFFSRIFWCLRQGHEPDGVSWMMYQLLMPICDAN